MSFRTLSLIALLVLAGGHRAASDEPAPPKASGLEVANVAGKKFSFTLADLGQTGRAAQRAEGVTGVSVVWQFFISRIEFP